MKKNLYLTPMANVIAMVRFQESMLASQAAGNGTGRDLSRVGDYDGQDFDALFN